MKSLTSGVLPSMADFRQYVEHTPDPNEPGAVYWTAGEKFTMSFGRTDGIVASLADIPSEFDDPDECHLSLRALIALSERGDKWIKARTRELSPEAVREGAASLAGSILFSLGYEWI